jgi:hypothetical protein
MLHASGEAIYTNFITKDHVSFCHQLSLLDYHIQSSPLKPLHQIKRKLVGTVTFQNVSVVLDQQALLDFYSASSLKQQSAGRHVSPLGHIIPIPSQPVFAPSS